MQSPRRHQGSRAHESAPRPTPGPAQQRPRAPAWGPARLALALVTGLSPLCTWALTTGGFAIDTQDRFLVRSFYLSAYGASVGAVPVWTGGSVATCAPGTTDAAFRDLVLLRVNYFRAMAGVPAAVTFQPDDNAKSQAAALMMSANNNLSHDPPNSWTCWSPGGADAAGRANLSLGYMGPDAVAGQMRDDGINNTAAGHRRWILYPQTQTMGTGDIPGSATRRAANTLVVLDGRYWEARPPTREEFVAWPPPGHVPYQLVFPRWSFSYAGADFSTATVQLRSNGTSIPTTPGTLSQHVGENTLVWVPRGRDPTGAADTWAAPAADTTYDVTIANVRIGDETRSFSYSVRVIDPGRPGAGEVVPRVSGPTEVYAGRPAPYLVAAVPRAIGYQVGTLGLVAHTRLDGAEPGTLGGIIDGTDATYDLVSSSVRATGRASFHLAHPSAQPQSFALADRFLVGTGSSLRFKSRLGWATANQVARVQLSLDDGRTWQDLYTQAGTGNAGAAAFTARTLVLAAYAGQVINLRFLYDLGQGSYYPQTQDPVGWYVDDIEVLEVERIASEGLRDLDRPDFSATAPTAGTWGHRARARLWDDLPPLDWGPVTRVTAAPAPPDAPLQVLKTGAGMGRVTSDPPGIDCGVTCQHAFPGAVPVTLRATAEAGSSFTGWVGTCTGTDDCRLPMDRDTTLTANFGLITGDDRDGDAIPDQWEREHGLDPATPDGDQDPDRDGADNLLEYQSGSDPQDAADLPAPLAVPARGGWRAILK